MKLRLICFLFLLSFQVSGILAQTLKTKKEKIYKDGYELYQYKKVGKEKVKHGSYQLYDRGVMKQDGWYKEGIKDSVWKYYGFSRKLYRTEYYGSFGRLDSSIEINDGVLKRITYDKQGIKSTFIQDLESNGITKRLKKDSLFYYNKDKSLRGVKVNNKEVGTWNYKLSDGFRTVCSYDNGVTKGVVSVYTPSGELYFQYNKNDKGQKHGQEVHFHGNDTVAIINYVNGELDGESLSFYNNGNIYIRANYKDSRLFDYEEFDKQGQKIQRSVFQAGSGRVIIKESENYRSVGVSNGLLHGPDSTLGDNGFNILQYEKGEKVVDNLSKQDTNSYSFNFFPHQWIRPESNVETQTKASFVLGEEGLDRLIMDNIVIPDIAYEEANSGTLYLQFVVDKNGELYDLRFVNKRKIGFGVEQAFEKVIESTSGKWIPASQNGEVRKMTFVKPLRLSFN